MDFRDFFMNTGGGDAGSMRLKWVTKPVKGGCVVFLMPCIGGATSRCRICVRYIEHLTDAQECLVMLQWTTVL
jgi:hypothetical protein